ncbi:PAS fold family [Verrucomicrobiia bacterium DG1235]|nr:PAS fold family [Verrucomicrobiae bacterium DG1235]
MTAFSEKNGISLRVLGAVVTAFLLALSVVYFLFDKLQSDELRDDARLVAKLVRECVADGSSEERWAALEERLGLTAKAFGVLALRGTEEGLLAGRGEVILGGSQLDRSELPSSLLAFGFASGEWSSGVGQDGFWYQLEAFRGMGERDWTCVVVRKRKLPVLWYAFERAGYILLIGFMVFIAIGLYIVYLNRGLVFGSLFELLEDMESRIERTSGVRLDRSLLGNEIETFSCRYSELLVALDRQGVELRQQREELRQLLDTLPAYVWYKDDKNNILRVNRAAADSVGFSIEELEGKSTKDVFPEEADEYYKDDLEVIESGQAKLGYVESYTPKKGAARTIRTDKIPYLDPNGKVVGVVALVTDITELVASQEALKAAEEEFRMAVESSPTGMVMIDSSKRVVLANNEAGRIFGYHSEELNGQSIDQLMSEEGLRVVARFFETLESEREKVISGSSGGLHALRKEGGVVPIELVCNPLFLSSGSFVMASVVDISSRLSGQLALRNSEERFQLAAAGASVGIWDWYDIEGEKVWWSPRFYQLIGYEESELESSLACFRSLLHPDDLEGTFARVNECLRKGGVFSSDYRLRCKDGQYRWYFGSGMVSQDEKGTARRMTGTIQDIHDRKLAESELSAVIADLREANEELSSFAFLSSHDLQEPLRTISSFVNLLKDEHGPKLDAAANEYIDFALTGVTRVQGMIRGLLKYSKLDAKPKSIADLSLRDAVDLAVSGLSSRIGETNSQLSIKGEFPEVRGDLLELSQVFQELLSNGMKFNFSDSPEVKVTGRLIDSSELGREGLLDGPYGLVSVCDDGIGISEKYRERVFTIFQRLHPADEFEGGGIGLSVVQKIVRAHEGQVWVETREGKGSCFCLALPVRV